MPEGPEMYRVAQRVAQAVADQPLSEVWFAFPELQRQAERLIGRRIIRVDTLGKALLIRFESGQAIYTHNQLYGRWMFAPAGRRPDTRRQLRLALSSANRSALLYSASEIELIEAHQVHEHPFIRRAGLDILSSGADPTAVAEWIARPVFARRRLGHLLLDQAFLAGVGNYLRSEILFLARMHPAQRPAELDCARIEALAEAAHTLMWRSVGTGGVTNSPERVLALKAAGWQRPDYRHFVFGREGQICFECDQPLLRELVSGRRLYRCPYHQPRPGTRSDIK